MNRVDGLAQRPQQRRSATVGGGAPAAENAASVAEQAKVAWAAARRLQVCGYIMTSKSCCATCFQPL